ncbi:MAG: 2-iminobutanoate/2-iminopropanoate deaminase [Lysobacterales bacterium]|jgi:2-iminobutanoate/2-iminopropanoate deaminase
MKTLKALIVLSIYLANVASAGQPEVEYYGVEGNMDLPFSEAVRVGHMLYLSGNLGNIPGTPELAEGGIKGETRQTMENIKTSLEKHGSSLDEVVKCTVFLADMAEWGEMNEVYITYFTAHPPARSALGTSGLALGARVEIECMATVK